MVNVSSTFIFPLLFTQPILSEAELKIQKNFVELLQPKSKEASSTLLNEEVVLIINAPNTPESQIPKSIAPDVQVFNKLVTFLRGATDARINKIWHGQHNDLKLIIREYLGFDCPDLVNSTYIPPGSQNERDSKKEAASQTSIMESVIAYKPSEDPEAEVHLKMIRTVIEAGGDIFMKSHRLVSTKQFGTIHAMAYIDEKISKPVRMYLSLFLSPKLKLRQQNSTIFKNEPNKITFGIHHSVKNICDQLRLIEFGQHLIRINISEMIHHFTSKLIDILSAQPHIVVDAENSTNIRIRIPIDVTEESVRKRVIYEIMQFLNEKCSSPTLGIVYEAMDSTAEGLAFSFKESEKNYITFEFSAKSGRGIILLPSEDNSCCIIM